MSEDTNITGEIRIDPPIPWPEIADEDWLDVVSFMKRSSAEAILRVVEEPVNTPEGLLLRRQANAIIAERSPMSGYNLTEHVRFLVDKYGEGRTFDGYLECTWTDGEDLWRIVVVNGEVKEIRPQIVWPELS